MKQFASAALIGFASSANTVLKHGEQTEDGVYVHVPVEWMKSLQRYADNANEELESNHREIDKKIEELIHES